MFLKIKHFKIDFNKWTVLIVAVSLFLAIPVFSILISLFRVNGEMWEKTGIAKNKLTATMRTVH